MHLLLLLLMAQARISELPRVLHEVVVTIASPRVVQQVRPSHDALHGQVLQDLIVDLGHICYHLNPISLRSYSRILLARIKTVPGSIVN